jgi:hypothetical protein
MTPNSTSNKRPPPRAAASITPSCSCPRPGAQPSPRSMRFAAKWTTWWTKVTDPGVARTKLAWWQAEVAKAFAGQPTHPVMQALMPLAATTALSSATCRPSSTAARWTWSKPATSTLQACKGYCHLVAGIVGEVAARIFGQTDPSAPRQYAHTAGPGVSAHQHHPRRGRRRHARAHLPAGQRAAAV